MQFVFVSFCFDKDLTWTRMRIEGVGMEAGINAFSSKYTLWT